jgi:hypothetical protein
MYFDSPMELCPRCNNYVLLDQSQKECASEHQCTEGDCPLARYFSGKTFETPAKPGPREGQDSGDG